MKTATIIVKDEVNIKIQGLDLDTRRRLVSRFKFEIPGARYMPAVRLGRWDGKVAYFQLSGSSFVNLLPEILPILIEEKYEIEVDDQRDYKVDYELEEVSVDSFSHVKWPDNHPAAGEPILLRDYQVTVINDFLKNPQSIQEVATGSGKTIMTAALSQRVERYGRSIVIVPNKSLVTQTEQDYRNMGLDVGVFYGDRKEFEHQHTICTWQSLDRLLKKSKNDDLDDSITIGEFLENVICVIVDEAHSAKADSLRSLLTGPMSHVPIRWGLTGTVPKEDYAYQALHVSIGTVESRLSASELQRIGVLANCHVNIVQLVDYVEFKNYQSEVKYLLNEPGRLSTMAGIIDKMKETGNVLVLVDRISAGKALEALIENSVFISGSTKSTDRQDHYDQVADSEGKIIIATYGIAAVGINLPRIFNLVLIEPGKSFVRVIQSIGRGVRKAQDKDYVQVWDITSTCKFAKRHLTKRKRFYKEAQYPFSIEKLKWQD